MIETAGQWDDEWWRLWEGARPTHDGEAAAAHADLEMSERHGPRPNDPLSSRGFRLDELDNSAAQFVPVEPAAPYAIGGVVPAGQLVCNGPDVAESVLRLARGANLELDPWQVDAIKRLYAGYIGGRRNGRNSARALVAEIQSRAQASPPPIIDAPPRPGWLGRLLDRVFG